MKEAWEGAVILAKQWPAAAIGKQGIGAAILAWIVMGLISSVACLFILAVI
jgi:hypothetical protein